MYSPAKVFSSTWSGPLTVMAVGGSFMSFTIIVKFFVVLSPSKRKKSYGKQNATPQNVPNWQSECERIFKVKTTLYDSDKVKPRNLVTK